MKRVLALAVHVVMLSFCDAKKCSPLKLISATRTEWAGGVAGRHGSNYNLELRFSSKYKIELDSVWFKTEGTYGLKQEENHSAFSLQVKTKTSSTNTFFEIIGGSFHDDGLRQHPDDFEKLQDVSNPFRVKGEAVVSYFFNKKKCFLAIPVFSNNPPINYP